MCIFSKVLCCPVSLLNYIFCFETKEGQRTRVVMLCTFPFPLMKKVHCLRVVIQCDSSVSWGTAIFFSERCCKKHVLIAEHVRHVCNGRVILALCCIWRTHVPHTWLASLNVAMTKDPACEIPWAKYTNIWQINIRNCVRMIYELLRSRKNIVDVSRFVSSTRNMSTCDIKIFPFWIRLQIVFFNPYRTNVENRVSS